MKQTGTSSAGGRSSNSFSIKFNPILSVYAVSDYQESEILRGEVNSPVLLRVNVAELPNGTNAWKLGYDFSTGKFRLEQLE